MRDAPGRPELLDGGCLRRHGWASFAPYPLRGVAGRREQQFPATDRPYPTPPSLNQQARRRVSRARVVSSHRRDPGTANSLSDVAYPRLVVPRPPCVARLEVSGLPPGRGRIARRKRRGRSANQRTRVSFQVSVGLTGPLRQFGLGAGRPPLLGWGRPFAPRCHVHWPGSSPLPGEER